MEIQHLQSLQPSQVLPVERPHRLGTRCLRGCRLHFWFLPERSPTLIHTNINPKTLLHLYYSTERTSSLLIIRLCLKTEAEDLSKFIYQMILDNLIFLFFLLPAFCFTPELVQLQLKISQLESNISVLSQKRYSRLSTSDDPSQQNLETYHYQEILLTQKCQFTGNHTQGFLFQTTSEIYLAVNVAQEDKVKIFNSECKLLSEISNTQIMQILNDRGVVQTGILYFLTQDHQLFHTYEDNQFQNTLKLATLKDIGIAGGIVRYRGKDRVEVFISYQDGTIEVYDESGSSKLRLFLEENKSQISLMSDHHPYPLIATKSNWISMLDTSKYVEISQNCPHIPDIKYILSENYYGQTIYIINSEKIFAVNFQISKKLCTIKREYQLTTVVNRIQKVSYFSNTLFIDNKVFNMTERKLYRRGDCHFEAQMEFISKRNQHDRDFALKRCCRDGDCTLQFLQVKRTHKDKSIFIWLTISFIVVIFISLSLMKKSNVSNIEIEETFSSQLSDKRINEISKRNREKNKNKKK